MNQSADDSWAGRRLGDFEVVREIGRGGMGVVFEAKQLSLNRKVALKVMSAGLGLTGNAVQRFQREAEAAAKLHHTNIVPVYATGEQDGTYYYAMELVEGSSLDRVIKQAREPAMSPAPAQAQELTTPPADDLALTGPYQPREAPPEPARPAALSSSVGSDTKYFDAVARMLAEVADALEYAHRQGVVHRDIKPSNLLLSPGGRLYLTDFGLARLLEQPGMTVTGEFVGTPMYMAPEQIAAGRVPIDQRADVYSLGATLYEVLTLRPPFVGERRDQVIAQVMQKEPAAPRRVNPRVPVDLETICLKAMDKDPDRRYQSAGQMAEDLRRYVNRFAIAARRAGLVARLMKWVRRHPGVAAALACALIAAGTASAFAVWVRHERQQREAEQDVARLRLLEEKVRSAYMVAANGDLKKTDEAIKEIEALGGSTGQVRMLRGTLAYFRGNAVDAIGELEQAIKLLPESVAARALLVMAYDGNGEAAKEMQILQEMERLTPSSSEDFLFRGYANEFWEPGQNLDDLDEGVRRQDSPLGRAFRALGRANRAADTGKREDAEAALADANLARGMLPNNLLVLYVSVYARVIAAGIYEEANLTGLRAAALEEAGRDARALEPFIELPNPAWAAWLFYEVTGNREKALRTSRTSLQKTGSPIAAYCCVVDLYQQKKFAEAITSIDQRLQPDLYGDVMRAFVLAELPDGSSLALKEHSKLARTYTQTGIELWNHTAVLLLLGKKEQAATARQHYRHPLRRLTQDWSSFDEAKRQFGSGRLSAEEYLAKAAPSRFRRFEAHYDIGLCRLAEGDRAGAMEHFQNASATRAYWDLNYFWCPMFLSRMEQDSTWPQRIQAKK